jgi:tetratricopeptide (TPR) repeat protein
LTSKLKFQNSKLIAALALMLIVGGAFYYARVRRAPKSAVSATSGPIQVPKIATATLDSAVAKLIRTTLQEVERAPNSGAAWGKLGSVLMHYEFVQETDAAFEQAEKLSPKEARWPYLHALALMNSSPEAALSKLRRAAELAPEQPEMPRLRLAEFLLERGRPDETESHFQMLLRRNADHAPAELGLARINFQRGRLSEASNLLTRSLHDPHTAKSANALLASVQRALGNVSAAEEASQRGATLPPDAPWPDPFWDEASQFRVGRKALLEQATTLMDQGRVEEALASLSVVTSEYPDDEEGWYLKGWAYNQRQQPVEAERALREHLRRSPRSAKGHAQLAVALLSQKRFQEAINVLNTALQLKATWRELHYNLGYACAQLGRTNEAISHLREALERDPNYLPTYLALAEMLIRRSEKDQARRLLSQALQLSPSDARALALLKQIESSQ